MTILHSNCKKKKIFFLSPCFITVHYSFWNMLDTTTWEKNNNDVHTWRALHTWIYEYEGEYFESETYDSLPTRAAWTKEFSTGSTRTALNFESAVQDLTHHFLKFSFLHSNSRCCI